LALTPLPNTTPEAPRDIKHGTRRQPVETDRSRSGEIIDDVSTKNTKSLIQINFSKSSELSRKIPTSSQTWLKKTPHMVV
jgi:hypothetical protein